MNIAVFGDTIIDKHVTINDLKPNVEHPDTLKANITIRHTTPGGAANVAMNVQSLGGYGPTDRAVTLYTAGARGDDYELVRSQLDWAGVTPILSSIPVRPVIKYRLKNPLSSVNPIVRFDVDSYDDWLTTSVNMAPIEAAGDDLRWPYDISTFVVSDYHKGFFGLEQRSSDARARIVDAAIGKLLVVDPGRHIPGKQLSNWQGWGSKDTVFKFNERQAREYLAFADEHIASDAEPLEVYRAVYRLFSPDRPGHGVLFKHLVITFGAKGYVTLADVFLHVFPKHRHLPPNLTDVCGAGDTFLAGLAVGLAEGKSILEACNFAQSAAGVAVRTAGTATVTRKDALT